MRWLGVTIPGLKIDFMLSRIVGKSKRVSNGNGGIQGQSESGVRRALSKTMKPFLPCGVAPNCDWVERIVGARLAFGGDVVGWVMTGGTLIRKTGADTRLAPYHAGLTRDSSGCAVVFCRALLTPFPFAPLFLILMDVCGSTA